LNYTRETGSCGLRSSFWPVSGSSRIDNPLCRYVMTSQLDDGSTHITIRKGVAQASDLLDERSPLQSIGIDPDAPIEPRLMVADTSYDELSAHVARNDESGVSLPLRVGATARCDDKESQRCNRSTSLF